MVIETINKLAGTMSNYFKYLTAKENNRKFKHYESQVDKLKEEIDEIKIQINKSLCIGDAYSVNFLMRKLERRQKKFNDISARLAKIEEGFNSSNS